MMSNKTVVIVAIQRYLGLAHHMYQFISDKKYFDCSYMAIADYEQNEILRLAFDCYIFLGHPEDCSITREFLPLFTNLENKAGVIYGVEGNKAVIFGDGDVKKFAEFEKLFKNEIMHSSYPPYNKFELTFTPILSELMKTLPTDRKKKARLRRGQTEMGIRLFLYEKFGLWISKS